MKERLALYLIVSVATLAASACLKQDPARQVISFTPVATAPATKAIIEGESYPLDESFVVSAYYGGSTAYFENSHVSYSDLSDSWSSTPAEYWPLEGSLTFQAYSPYGVSGVSLSSSGATATSYTVQTVAQRTTDLCFASASVADCSNPPESVDLEFHHALSQVAIRVRAAEYYSTGDYTYTLQLTSLELRDVKSVGNYSGSGWSVNTNYNYTVFNTPTALTYDAENDNAPVFLDACQYLFLPQELDGATLRVGYRLTRTKDEETTEMKNTTVSLDLSAGSVTEWEAGRLYQYSIDISLDDNVALTLEVQPWEYHTRTYSGEIEPRIDWDGTRLEVFYDRGLIVMDNWAPAHCEFYFGTGDQYMATIVGDGHFTFCLEDGTALVDSVPLPDGSGNIDNWKTSIIGDLSYSPIDDSPIHAHLYIKVVDYTTTLEHDAILRFYLRSREGDWRLVRMTTPVAEGWGGNWGSSVYECKLVQNYK